MKRIIALLSIGFMALHASSCDLLDSPINIAKGGTFIANGGRLLGNPLINSDSRPAGLICSGGACQYGAGVELAPITHTIPLRSLDPRPLNIYPNQSFECNGIDQGMCIITNKDRHNVHTIARAGMNIQGKLTLNHKTIMASINDSTLMNFDLFNDHAKLTINAPVTIHAHHVTIDAEIEFGTNGYLIIIANNVTYGEKARLTFPTGASDTKILVRATNTIHIKQDIKNALLMANERIIINSNTLLTGALSTKNLVLNGTISYLKPQKFSTHLCAKTRGMDIAFQQQLEGDIEIIGNSVLLEDQGGGTAGCAARTDDKDDDKIDVVYADIDSDSTTKNSTSAKLELPDGAEVIWAGLYWQGFSDEARAQTGRVKLKTPAMSDYTTITSDPQKLNSQINRDAFYHSYQGAMEITEYVRNGGNGNYVIADVETLAGKRNSTFGDGKHGAWAIAVVYKKGNSTSQDFKQITIYDGLIRIDRESKSFTIDRFFTPAQEELPYVKADLWLFSVGGDLSDTDSLALTDKQGNAIKLRNSLNPVDNIMNSTLTRHGAQVGADKRNPACPNTIGVDIDSFQVGNNPGALHIIGHKQTQTTATLITTDDPDFFNLGLLALAINSYRVYDISKEFLPDSWCRYSSTQTAPWRREGGKLICSGYIERPHGETFNVKIIASGDTELVAEGNYPHDNRYKAIVLPFVDIGEVGNAVKISTKDGSVELSDSKVFGNIKAGRGGRISFYKNTFKGTAITKGKISSSNDDLSGCFQADGSQERDTSSDLAGLAIHIGENTKIRGTLSAYHKDVKFDKARNEGEPFKILGQDNKLLLTYQSHFTKTHVGGFNNVVIEANSTLMGHLQDGIPAPSGFTLDPTLSPLSNYGERCDANTPAPAPTQGTFRVIETGKSWNQDKIKTKVFGNALSFDILHSTDNGATLTEGKIKKLELWDHSGATPQLVQTIRATETTITGGRLSVPIPALAKPYKHLKFHIIADDTNGIEQTTLSDSFALRPARFELKALKKPTDTSPCDESAASSTLKAKAGEEFCLFAYAKDPAGNPIAGYNAGLGASDSLEIAYKEPEPKLRTGELSPNPSEQAFTDGKLILPKVHYSEVGEPKLTLKERENREWALVDKDDTPDDERLITPTTIKPEFTLAKFGFKDLKLTSKFGGNFSFFDLLPNPSVTPIPNSKLLTLSYTLEAQNEQGQVTKNYVQGGYAKPATLTRTLPTGIILPEGTKLIHETQGSELKIYPENQDEALTQLPLEKPTFPLNLPAGISDATTANDPKAGTQTFTEEFSFATPRTKPANPIKFHGAQPLALEAKETGDPNIKGEASITNDMTLYFARINALDSYEEDGNVKSKVYYEVYCKGRISDECQGFDKANYSVNSAYWYKFKFGIDPDAEGSYTTGTVEGIENNDSLFREELALKPDHFRVDDRQRHIKPSKIDADPDGSGFFVVLEFDANNTTPSHEDNIADNTRRQGRIEHGDGKFPAFFYFHPYRDYEAGDTFTTFTVSKTKNPDNKENVVKTNKAKNARGASRVGD